MTDVATLQLAAGKANAMTPEVLDQIERLIDGYEASAATAAVLTGYEKFFSGGLALPRIIDFDRKTMQGFITRFTEVMRRVWSCEKPIVAAINGHAIAGGCVLALMCDYRIMVDDETLRIGLNETQLGIGLPPAVLEPLRVQLPPLSMPSVALAGELFSPARAHYVGLVHEVGSDAFAKARMFGEVPPKAFAQVKRELRAGVAEAMGGPVEPWLDTWFSVDAQKRLRAIVEKMNK
jgi:enoyl-CoA hydratase